jgi:phage recombination protein Bet
MSTALQLLSQNKAITIWEDETKLNEIRKLFAPKLTPLEFQYFVRLGMETGLNPFMKELWAVKYGDSPAQIFIGRDGYRKSAQRYPDYNYHQCDTVYANDQFKIVRGEIEHSYTLQNRGELIGAYCIVKRRHSEKPIYVFVEFSEYSTDKSLWKTKPATMIKKVAEAQALRMAFQDLLGGTYCPEELEHSTTIEKPLQVIEGHTQTEKLKSYLNISFAEPEEVINDESLITDEQINTIYEIMSAKGFTEERTAKAIDYILKRYKVDALTMLTTTQAQEFITKLEAVE